MSDIILSPMTVLEALSALHYGQGAAVALARSVPGGWQECGAILTTDLPAKWPSVETHFKRDSYFTLSSTYAQPRATRISALDLPLWSRRAEHLRWLNAVAVELDAHADPNFSIEPLLEAFQHELIQHQIPLPTFIQFSGRGLWALWQLVDHLNRTQPVRAFADKRDLMQRIARALVARFKALGADRQSTDPARVMRLPDSFNSKAAPENSRVRFFRISELVYTLPELGAALGVHARKVALHGERKRKDSVKAQAAVMRWRYPLQGFEQLWKMRGGFTQGTRRPAIYVYSMLLRKNRATPKQILAACLRLAESLSPTVSDADVKHQIASGEKAVKYNFSNAKLGAMLKITSAERAALPRWFRPKRKSKSSMIADRRAVIRRELQAAAKPISTQELVTLLLEKHGLRVSRFMVMRDVRFLAGCAFPVLIEAESSLLDKQRKCTRSKNSTKTSLFSYKQKKCTTSGNGESAQNDSKTARKRMDKGAARLSTKNRSHCWVQSGGSA